LLAWGLVWIKKIRTTAKAGSGCLHCDGMGNHINYVQRGFATVDLAAGRMARHDFDGHNRIGRRLPGQDKSGFTASSRPDPNTMLERRTLLLQPRRPGIVCR